MHGWIAKCARNALEIARDDATTDDATRDDATSSMLERAGTTDDAGGLRAVPAGQGRTRGVGVGERDRVRRIRKRF